MTATYAVISIVLNVVLNLVVWDGNTATWTPPDGTYAVAVPSGVTVAIGDSYNPSTQVFTANNVPPPTPVPSLSIGDCTTPSCFGGTGGGPQSGSNLDFYGFDPNTGPVAGGVRLGADNDYVAGDIRFLVLPKFPSRNSTIHPGVDIGATLVAVENTGTIWTDPGESNVVAGDLLVASGSNLFKRIPKSTTATRYLANTGASNEAEWNQVNLANGVTGTLPIANGGTGNTTGLAATATALQTNPTDCGANTYATTIDASGNLTCSSVSLTAGVSGALPIANGGTGNTTGLAATATALAADPADCASNRYATAINASGTLTCGQVSLSAGVTGTLPVSNGGTGAAPGADDQVFVSSSTSAGAWAAVPNCTDTSGSHLNYTASTNSFSCGTTSSASPTVGSDLTCDTSSVASTSAVTVLTLPTFSNTGKTTVISGAVAINASAAGASRTYTVDVKLGGTSQITFTGKTESATSKVAIPFHWVDSTCGSSCAYTVTVTSDATTGTQTVTDCAASRVSY